MTKLVLLKPIKYVIDHSQHVSINYNAIDTLTHNFKKPPTTHWTTACPFPYHNLPLKEEINFRCIVGSMAFCFWGYPQKWTITYQDQKLDGWWALIACFKKALENNWPILDGNFLVKLTIKQTAELFSGSPEIPLINERKNILNQIGQTLVNNFNGKFYNYLLGAPSHAVKLTQDIADTFLGLTTFIRTTIAKFTFIKKLNY